MHLLGDVASFAVSIFAIRLGSGSASQRFTFGLARAEVLGALASTLITLALTMVLVYEAVVRSVHSYITCAIVLRNCMTHARI